MKKTHRFFSVFHPRALGLLILLLLVCDRVAAASAPPNIIVIVTDDLGYADLGVQGAVEDIRTPNLDAMAKEGIRCTSGYVTAPQCSPSRAGLLTGRYQQRLGIDQIPDMPLPLKAVTIAERLRPAGYTSAMIGKWHLEPNEVTRKWMQENGIEKLAPKDTLPFFPGAQGFDFYYKGELKRYYANYSLDGTPREPGWVNQPRFRVDVQTDAALAFIDQHHKGPFFVYLNYFAPHTPLEVPPAYLKPEWKNLPLRRQAALSMIAAVDHGVGRLGERLSALGLDKNTLIFFTSDNGAPLHGFRDSPINTDAGGWDGSLNTPLNGEKGMLAEGGIRVPFLMQWKGKLPAGMTYQAPVSTLDIAATANAAAGLPADPQLDGINLLPLLEAGAKPAERTLFWRFMSQTAAREGDWKYLRVGYGHEFLFNLQDDPSEKNNLAASQPAELDRLRAQALAWTQELTPPGFPTRPPNPQEAIWFPQYFGVKIDGPPSKK